MSKVYADQVVKATDLVGGINKNLPVLKRFGIDVAVAMDLEAMVKKVQDYDAKKDRLREELHNFTTESNDFFNSMKQKVSEVKQIIKLNFPQEEWASLGIHDLK